MTTFMRSARPALRPFIRAMWISQGTGAVPSQGGREHAIPTGEMHLVVRVTDAPVRIFTSPDDYEGQTCGLGVVAGPRASFHIKDVSAPVQAVGVQLHPAASRALFGAPAELLAHRHIPLDALWTATDVEELRERIALAGDPQRQMDILEAELAQRLPRVQGLHPAVAIALQRLDTITPIDDLVRASGYSHRTFSTEFRRTMGLGPKRFQRVQRMVRLLRRLGTTSWADVAAEAGFSDQAHFVREFVAFTGVTPTYYRRVRPSQPHHVRIVQDGRRPPQARLAP